MFSACFVFRLTLKTRLVHLQFTIIILLKMFEGEYFPRGGIKPATGKQDNSFKKEENLFALAKPKIKKTEKSRKRSKSKNDIVEEQLLTADTLSYSKIQEGMLILGCIRSISSITIQVELPGRVFGKIHINSISDMFTTKFKEFDQTNELELGDIFHVGQFIPTKVLEVKKTEKGINILLSMKPNCIHSNYTHRSFNAGNLIWASVLEKSDHGYLLDAGVKNVNIILPFDYVDKGKEYIDGEPLWCVVKKVNKNQLGSILHVSACMVDINSNREANGSLDHVIPGMLIDLNIQRILKDGLEGRFFFNCIGLINELYLNKPFETKEKYAGQSVKACVLYTQPMTKITYFSLRTFDTVIPRSLEIGFKIKAKVVQKAGSGLILQLNNTEKGIVTYKRLVNSLKMNAQMDLDEVIRTRYPVNSIHQCRILDFVRIDRLYMCTFESNVLKEPVFTINDVKIGSIVEGTISEINNNGIVVKIGKVYGFVPNEHLCNVLYSDNIKRKFMIGQHVRARVWNIEDGKSIKLTLKEALVNSDVCLKSYREIKNRTQYPGVVVKIMDSGALIKFYGGVKGMLKLDDEGDNHDNKYMKMFYIGQVIKPTVANINNSKITLTLQSSDQLPNKHLKVGNVVNNGTIVNITDHDVTVAVKINKKKIDCILPFMHISFHPILAESILKSYVYKQKIYHLICISNTDIPILSLREYNYYKDSVLSLSELKVGDVIRCSLKEVGETALLLTSPIRHLNKDIIIPQGDISDEGRAQDINFKINQSIYAKITNIDETNKVVVGTTRLSEVYNYDLMYSATRLHEYLDYIMRIKYHLTEVEDPITMFEMGQHVTCTVEKINNKACIVALAEGVYGVVELDHCPRQNLQIGQTVKGVILWIDYVHKGAMVSLRSSVINKVSQIQDEKIDIECGQCTFADILLICKEFAICVLGSKGRKQLAYIPMELHENDFMSRLNYYKTLLHKTIKLKIFLKDKMIIGFEKTFVKLIKDEAKMLMLKSRNLQKNKLIERKRSNKGMSKTRNSNLTKTMTVQAKSKEIPEENISEDSEEAANSSSDDDQNSEISEDKSEHSEDKSEGNISQDSEEAMNSKSSSEDDENSEITENKSEHSEDISETNDESELEIELSENENSNPVTDSNHRENEDSDSEMGIISDHELSNNEKKQTELNSSSLSGKENGSDYNENTKRIKFAESEQIRTFRDLDIIEVPEVGPKAVLPGITDFFESDDEIESKNHLMASIKDEPNEEPSKKKRKLTPTEQSELIIKQENSLRKREEEIADLDRAPQNADEFERKLLAEPNSSMLWCNYIAFALNSNEIDKARGIVKRGLNSISLDSTQERLNLWITYLNLENMHGTKQTFDAVFDEAVRCNDDLIIYLETIEILTTNPNPQYLEEKISKARTKFKQVPKMYIDIGKVYYKEKRFADARKLRDDALKILIDKKTHTPLIVQFAIMEFNFGEDTFGESLFETVIQSDPQRTDVWITYIDQLVKKLKIDLARKVLERAVSQKLNHRKMKSLFKKFENFENKYGTEITKNQQKKLLEEYLEKFNKE